ncbi:Lysylphosphatidylglycerol biosynthesis bifunctional protein LysX [Actinomyces bovis]|uniref:Lysine--tRNA ligase n=1 Tax=Actinomyces bovis TaxID=1658 RepID=A0ABY1VLJ0_9ACTO|nr:bifunctional lysylphosphatidylglycerol synthetase/lysine--tRNA ligase LysX [Actinomyces bovis]SPT52880.1 Lysylphosphatidylglycerol biosynthesis bifunctional protein LysX [Actinomyces bovis]VEG55002.1 Lysylphosphatidylglycerol biosynthesis bifunctional protein LysX [Actinomyces israelii]
MKRPPRPGASRKTILMPRVFLAIGLVSLLATVFGSLPPLDRPLDFIVTWFIPLFVLDWLTAVVILILADGLRRRVRNAWRGALILVLFNLSLFGTVLVAITLRPELEDEVHSLELLAVNTGVLVLLLVLLLRERQAYTVRMRPGNMRRAVLVALTSAGVVTLVFLAVAVALHPSNLFSGSADSLTGNLAETLAQAPGWLDSLLGLGLTLSLLVGLCILMRSQQLATRMSTDDERRVRTLLAQNPSDSLGYFATRRDKTAFLTEHGGVAYRTGTGVALVSGDPLGPSSTWTATASAFLTHAASYGLTPAVIGASEAGAQAWVQAGLHTLHIGDEAVLRPSLFRLNELPEVRQAVRHVTAAGYQTRVRRQRAVPTAELTALGEMATRWLDGEPERGFSMALGRSPDDLSDAESVIVEALFPEGDERGQVAALLSFVPWGADGLSLNVMRRHPQADHGVTELMVSAVMAEASTLGVVRVSLNFAVFRSAFDAGARIGAGPIQRAWRRILLLASRWWQLESLYRSNAKYNPEWVPRLICYEDSGSLPQVALAMGVAEGFVHLGGPLGQPDTPQPRLDESLAREMAALTFRAASSEPERKVPREVKARITVRDRMLRRGLEPYPASVAVTASCREALQSATECTVAGRVVALRDHGGVVFADLRDWSGDLQVILDREGTGAEALRSFQELVRAGDQVAFTGSAGASRTGTASLLVTSWTMTSKALRPLPDKRRGIQDPEARVRLRHLTLITSPEQRHMVAARSQAVQAVRSSLLERGFLEVETPMLQLVHGGANARPFRTHINAYDLDLYLRIAPELYLKRLMVGGLDRVFEIGRNFRNEGADATHNPEFTMLEAYQAYSDYEGMKGVVQDLVVAAARAALGTTVVRGTVKGVEHEIDLAKPWRTVSVCDAVSEGLGVPVDTGTSVEELCRHAEHLGLSCAPSWGWGALVQELYEHLAEDTTVGPTFFSDFPAQTSPLTRQHRRDPMLAERWDLIIFGSEVGTAYSELVDPVIQRQRLTAQSLAAAGGDPEAMELDESFLAALEQGMPPTGGLGVGLDRLVMMLTNATIRETIAFPLVRPNQ